MKTYYDVVVVGGGPAGSTAARFAAEAGAAVLLVEKDREIGIPVRCAEAVGEKGIRSVVDLKAEWIANHIEAVRLIAPNGTKVKVFHQDVGFVLDRKQFDYGLALLAAQAGAEVVTKAYVFGLLKNGPTITGVKVRQFGKEFEIKAKIVIGADGIESRVGRWAGLKTHLRLKDVESCAQMTITNIAVDKQYCDFYFSDKIAPGGYLWVFPKNQNTANVGLGISSENGHSKSALAYLKEFVNKKFPHASILTTIAGGVPCAPYMEEMVGDGIMLVGDAAHQANPISGGGIVTGILASKIAGQVAAKAIADNDISRSRLHEYQSQWEKAEGVRHRQAYRLKEGIYKLSDQDLNEIAAEISKKPPEKQTIINIFKTALVKQPKLIPDVLKVFWG